jgi:WD40 repeat protein
LLSPQHETKSFCRFASDYVASDRLTKKQSEEIINKAGGSTCPASKSVLRTEATRVTSVTWSADGRYIASSSTQDNRIHIWDVATRRIVHEFKSTTSAVPMHELSWSPDSKWLIACDGSDSRFLVINTTTWQPPQVLNDIPDSGQFTAFSSDGSQLAIVGQSIIVYSTSDWRVISRVDLRAGQWSRGKLINAIAYLPNTHTVVLGGAELARVGNNSWRGTDSEYVGYVWIFAPGDTVPSARHQAYFPSDSSQAGVVTLLATSPNGQEFATGANTGTGMANHVVADSVHIMRASDGSIRASPLDGKGYSQESGLAYTPDGHFLIVGHGSVHVDHVVHVLDTQDYNIAGSAGVKDTIYDVATDPSSKFFAVGAGGTISVWTLPTN